MSPSSRTALELGEQLVVAGHRLGPGLPEVLGHLLERHREGEVVDHHVGRVALLQHLVAGEALGVAAEDDVDAAPAMFVATVTAWSRPAWATIAASACAAWR